MCRESEWCNDDAESFQIATHSQSDLGLIPLNSGIIWGKNGIPAVFFIIHIILEKAREK